jgi:hypothetical protein
MRCSSKEDDGFLISECREHIVYRVGDESGKGADALFGGWVKGHDDEATTVTLISYLVKNAGGSSYRVLGKRVSASLLKGRV